MPNEEEAEDEPPMTRAEDDDSDDESSYHNEELLAALQSSLLASEPAPKHPRRTLAPIEASSVAFDLTVSGWPSEVRLCVATFLPWQEVVAGSLLSRSWRSVECQDVLWKSFFCCAWPRLAQRQLTATAGASPWRALFRARWLSKHRDEDALEEDWLDFCAAQDLGPSWKCSTLSTGGGSSLRLAAIELHEAVKRCREELDGRGCSVPSEVQDHHCTKRCRYHRLGVEGYDAFLCEASGALHTCRPDEPCDFCVATADESFLVCPVSGRCFEKPHEPCEEALESAAAQAQAWDLELGVAHQFDSWFEQGYSMSEDQAKDFFGTTAGDQVTASTRILRSARCS